jgi:hypothetical protein
MTKSFDPTFLRGEPPAVDYPAAPEHSPQARRDRGELRYDYDLAPQYRPRRPGLPAPVKVIIGIVMGLLALLFGAILWPT